MRMDAGKLARMSAARRRVGPVLVAIGLLLLIPFAFRGWDDVRAFTQSRAATCTIIGKRLTLSSTTNGGSSGSRESTFYAPEFTMRYELEGRQRIASGYDASGVATGSAAHNQEILDRYALWQDYPCWYDVANPGRVVLKRSISLFYLLAIWPLLALALGVGFVRSARNANAAAEQPLTPSEELPRAGASSPSSVATKLGGTGTRRWFVGIGVSFALAAAALVYFFVTVLVPAYRPTPASDADRLEMFKYFETGQLGSVRANIEYGVSPDARDAHGVPLLTRTLERCDVKAQDSNYGEFAVYLLQKGANINAKSSDGSTPLIAAARACPLALVRTLIDAGAQVNDSSGDGVSALRVAVQQNRSDVVQLLRASGARD
jgi:hypothetical protein